MAWSSIQPASLLRRASMMSIASCQRPPYLEAIQRYSNTVGSALPSHSPETAMTGAYVLSVFSSLSKYNTLPAGIEGFHEGFLPSSNSSTWSGKSALALLLSFFGKFSTSTYKYQGIQHNAGWYPIQFGIHRGPYRASPARRRPKTSRLDPDGRLRLSTLSTVETVAPWHIQTSPI